MNEGFVVGLPVGDFVLLLCHGTACIIRMMHDLIQPFGKSSIHSTKPIHLPGAYREGLRQVDITD